MRNGLGHRHRVNDDAFDARGPYNATAARSVDGRHQQGFHAFFADALPSAHEAAGVDGGFDLQAGQTHQRVLQVDQPAKKA